MVVGADFSRTAVAKAAALGRASGAPALRLAVADVQVLALRDTRFDLVISCETIEHVADARAAVREMARVLRPGGTLLLTAPNYLGLLGAYRIYRELTGRPWAEEGQPVNTVTTLPRTVAWVRQAGLEVVSVDGIGHDLPIPGRQPLPLTWLDGGGRPLRWLAAHGFRLSERWYGPFRLAGYRTGNALAADFRPLDARFGEGISLALGYGALAAREVAEAFETGDFSFRGYKGRVMRSSLGRTLVVRWLTAQVIYNLRWKWFQRLLWRGLKPVVRGAGLLFVVNWGRKL